MESSAISLYFKVANKLKDADKPVLNEYVINLIDSPGHIDFSSEVSTASRLCDGAIVVVDAVEGVCSQTVTVLRQCWDEQLKPLLLINKVDRLILELQLTPLEAYIHINKLIEQVNAVVGSFFAGQRMNEDLKWRESQENGGQSTDFVEASDENLYFAPETNNVIFGSAIDGWGFNLQQFANIFESKLGIPSDELAKYLYGDNYYNSRMKKVIQGAQNLKTKSASKPMFVQLILENIWAVYHNVILTRDQEKIEKIVRALNIKLVPRDLKIKDSRALLTTIFNQWIPMSRAVLLSVIDKVPSPVAAQQDRMDKILESTPGYFDINPKVVNSMKSCDMDGPVAAFISKVQAVPVSDLPKPGEVDESISQAGRDLEKLRIKSQKARELALAMSEESSDNSSADDLQRYSITGSSSESEDAIIGLARVFSGTLEVGQRLNCLGPRYNPRNPDEFCTEVTITGLYLMMGKDLLAISKAPAGAIVGIGGLDGKILKSGTLVSQEFGGPNLASTNSISYPILRVAVETVDPTKLPQLEEGLKLLNISDPCVHVTIQENGEHILATAGELHLERCIKDLKERFAKCEITYSKPIVPFRETFVVGSGPSESSTGAVEAQLGTYKIMYQLDLLPEPVVRFINDNADRIRGITSRSAREEDEEMCLVETSESEVNLFKHQLADLLEGTSFLVDNIVSLGPRRIGPNIFLDNTGLVGQRVFPSESKSSRLFFEENIITGFQLAMASGPLCGEPLEGVAVSLMKAEETPESDEDEGDHNPAANQGRFITTTREVLVQGLSQRAMRLKLATYLCDIQTTGEALGKVYGVITKRRGKILTEEMKEGTPFFTIRSSIPVVESFGFSEDMRKRTSGAANPQLVFNGFELLPEDPFWVPTTEEELEELGELGDKENIALRYVNGIRKRRGLPVHAKLIENAERQRTMKR